MHIICIFRAMYFSAVCSFLSRRERDFINVNWFIVCIEYILVSIVRYWSKIRYAGCGNSV